MHCTTRKFWECYDKLSKAVQKTADQSYELLKKNSSHPSLHFKKVGRYWSVRVGQNYRALGTEEAAPVAPESPAFLRRASC